MQTYPKIPSPFKRFTEGPRRNRFDLDTWSSRELEILQDVPWAFTEKVDGTNIRVHWDGHKVTFGGRTDNAQIPATLVQRLIELFPEELFEQKFKEDPVTLFGEGYGVGIQKNGGRYKADGVDFILFDVLIEQWWLRRPSIEEVASGFNIETVPQRLVDATLVDAIERVRDGMTSSWALHDSFQVEGLVGVPECGLLTRGGERIMVKIKTEDFRH
jgi:hypothetical protein